MDKPRGALYLKCSRTHAAVSWACVGANLACVLACVSWAVRHHAEVAPGAALWIGAALAGILLSDLLTGIVHWATDTWLDEQIMDRVGCIAREHHLYPAHIVDYGLRDYLSYMSLPSSLVFGPLCLVLMLALPPSAPLYFVVVLIGEVCFTLFFGTHFHRLGHTRAKSLLVRLLQRAHVLITPRYHNLHHSGNHDRYYCVVTGWMNPICDGIGFFRGLEWIVHALTGAVPRQSDEEWKERFAKDPSFVHDPLPSLLELRAARAAADKAGDERA
jgi:ubiquitin-conjugating enzyme E2 variant